ncbi:MAG: hypothetical protein ABSG65_29010 [Bryobacteraceae bacterium]
MRHFRHFVYWAIAGATMLVPFRSDAQTAQDAIAATGPVTVEQKWQFFLQETFSPMTIVASAATAGESQATNTDPKYGVGSIALVKRFGAASLDNVTQNFFCDFVMASVFHENNKYHRRGEQHGFWSRAGYAVSRSVITRTDAGASTVNWSNFTGTALSVALSNAYYPMRSRNLNATAINWGFSTAGTGFGNLAPEFLPDVKRWLKRHHL